MIHTFENVRPHNLKTLSVVTMASFLIITIIKLKNRMWFSVVCTLIDNDIRHHSGQNLLWTHQAQPSESTTNFDHCDDEYRCR